jgi:glycosyltransferase involved in cell wall biosynthesis
MCLMFHANMLGRFAGRAAGVPIIVTSERSVGWESRARIAVNRLTVSLSDAITTNSAEGVRFWSEALGGRVPVMLIYNGVDTDSFSPAPRPAEPVLIGNLARLHRKNGQEFLLDALARLDRRNPGLAWRAVVAGSGPEEKKLHRMASGLGLANRLEMRPYTPDPAGFLKDLSIYVQSSVAEGLPNAVLEAMSVGLPVVATAVGGTPELVDEGTTGLLVPPRDPAALADALETLVVRPDLRADFGARARARVLAHFSAAAAAEATEKLLDALAAEKGLGGRRSR